MKHLNGEDEQAKEGKPSVPTSAAAISEDALFRSMSMNKVSRVPHTHDKQPRDLHRLHPCHAPTCQDKSVLPPLVWAWKMSNPLRPPPLFHPLEPTAVTIENLTVDTITARISGFMKDHSISCSYNDGFVECSTDDLLRFVVQLWKGLEPNKNSIIVEVQRRSGCCIRMQGLRSKLMKVIISGQAIAEQPRPLSQVTCEFLETLVTSFSDPPSSSDPPPTSPKSAPRALKRCRNLLESNHLNEKRLGLESLCILTDPTKCCVSEVDKVCHEILTDVTLQNVLATFFPESETIQSSVMVDCSDDKMSCGQWSSIDSLHVLVLKVLSHALEYETQKKKSATIGQSSIDLSSIFWQTVLQATYYNLEQASRRPIVAALSIRCLRLMRIIDPATSTYAPSPHLHRYLLNAHHFGLWHSRSLERESEMLMRRLGFVVY